MTWTCHVRGVAAAIFFGGALEAHATHATHATHAPQHPRKPS